MKGLDNYDYIYVYKAKNEQEFGIRRANVDDAGGISEVFENNYGYNYLDPIVYDLGKLKKKILDPNHYWYVAVELNSSDVVGCSNLEIKNEFEAYAGKLVFKKEYQGLGIASVIGTQASIDVFTTAGDVFKKLLRINNDIRATNPKSQKFALKANNFPYGFVPNFNNYADKRNHINEENPFSEGDIEPVILSFFPLNNIWRKREKDVFLLNNGEVKYFYDCISNMTRKMRKDELHLENAEDDPKKFSDYNIDKDIYRSIVTFTGYIAPDKLDILLEEFKNWNCIVWQVPTSRNGVYYQKIAMKNEFLPGGYNPGSFISNTIHDAVVFLKFPSGIVEGQFNCIDLIDEVKPIAGKVIEKCCK